MILLCVVVCIIIDVYVSLTHRRRSCFGSISLRRIRAPSVSRLSPAVSWTHTLPFRHCTFWWCKVDVVYYVRQLPSVMAVHRLSGFLCVPLTRMYSTSMAMEERTFTQFRHSILWLSFSHFLELRCVSGGSASISQYIYCPSTRGTRVTVVCPHSSSKPLCFGILYNAINCS